MWKKFFVVGLLCALMTVGCTGLRRGMVGDAYVSSAKPAFSVSVPTLPLRAAGSATSYVTTEDSLGGIGIDSWLAVYGGSKAGEAMAIVAQAEIPPAWYWDSNMYRTFSVNQGTAVFDGRLYQACTYIVDGATDAFTLLVPDADQSTVRWIARRFAARTDFNVNKITLEYREPLPQGFETLSNLPVGGNTFLDEFAERAEKAFTVSSANFDSNRIRATYIEGLRIRYLNTNFWGTMSRYDIMD